MNATFKIITLLFIVLFSACEEVVDIDLDTAPPKLVIDAPLKWKKGTTGNQQTITLTTTADFYATEVPPATGATVFVTNGTNVRFDFIETPGTGIYMCSNFIPEIGQTYILTVIYQGQTYTATEQLKAVPQIDSVEQNNNGGLTGNEIEVKFLFQDPPNTPNFFLIQFQTPYSVMPEYDVIDDAFFQGNQIFGLYASDRLKVGDEIQFTLHGISQRYFNYLNILLSVAGTNSGSPFQTPPATVRGNIINQTNFDNFALGFFSASEIDQQTYIIQ
jgi:hypothetical protein